MASNAHVNLTDSLNLYSTFEPSVSFRSIANSKRAHVAISLSVGYYRSSALGSKTSPRRAPKRSPPSSFSDERTQVRLKTTPYKGSGPPDELSPTAEALPASAQRSTVSG